MSTSPIAACYYPTTVLMIDDDMAYLHNVRSDLAEDKAVYQLLDNPIIALKYLNNEYHADPFIKRIIERPDENPLGQHSLDFNLFPIREEVYNPLRFEQLSMIIIDQQMPGLKGLDFCRQVKDIGPVKKLMLTGEVDDRQAIEAFNEGIIQQFINKKERDFSERVNQAIRTLQHQYFHDLSQVIFESLNNDPARNTPSCFSDEKFIAFFKAFFQEKNLAEYYLCDDSGSFMFIDFYGQPSWLAIRSQDDMHAIYTTAETADSPPSQSILDDLKNNKQLLYTHTDADTYVAPSAWQAHGFLHPAQCITGDKQNYYYAYITDPKAYTCDTARIFPFHDHIEKIAAQSL